MDDADEAWLAQGGLSEDEFDQLVRLTARYFCYNVDQFDDWKMPGPWGNFYVSFGWEPHTPDRRTDDGYRPMWPTAAPGEPAFAVIAVKPDGSEHEVSRWTREVVANLQRDLRAGSAWFKAKDGDATYLVRPV
jgi:hypothetical protein